MCGRDNLSMLIDYAENLKMIKKYGYNGSLMLEVYAKEKDAELSFRT